MRFYPDTSVQRVDGGWRLARPLPGTEYKSPLACVLTDFEAFCLAVMEHGLSVSEVLDGHGGPAARVDSAAEEVRASIRPFMLDVSEADSPRVFPNPVEILRSLAAPRIDGALHRAPLPREVAWYVSTRCPRRCRYCHYVQKGRADLESDALAAEDVDRMINQCAIAGVGEIALTGGEPLLRPDVFRILRRISDTGVHSSLFSRASYSPALARSLADAGVGEVYYSLDSIDPEINEIVVEERDVADDALTSIRHLSKAGVRVVVAPVLHRLGIGRLEALAAAVKRAGAQAMRPLLYKGSTVSKWNDLLIPTDEQRKAIPELLRRVESMIHVDYSVLRLEPTVSCCESGFSTLYVMPDGRVAYCPFLNDHRGLAYGDVRDGTIWDLWYAPRLREIMQSNHLTVHGPRLAVLSGQKSACFLRNQRMDII